MKTKKEICEKFNPKNGYLSEKTSFTWLIT